MEMMAPVEKNLELCDPAVFVRYQHARLELTLVDVGHEAGLLLGDVP
jgi:hypothetical protein